MEQYNDGLGLSYDEQWELEEKSDALAVQRMMAAYQKEVDAGSIETVKHRRLISNLYQKVVAELEPWHERKGARGKPPAGLLWIQRLDPKLHGVVAIRNVLATLSGAEKGWATLQSLSIELGKQLALEVMIKEAETVNPEYMRTVWTGIQDRNITNRGHIAGVYRKAYDHVLQGELSREIPNSEYAHIGKFGVDALYQVGLIEALQVKESRRVVTYYVLSEEVREYLLTVDSSDFRHITDTASTAMIHPPKPWTTLSDGGYLTHRRQANNPLMRLNRFPQHLRKQVFEEFTAENMPDVFNYANRMQSVAYEFNPRVVELVKEVWKSGGGAMGIPPVRHRPEPDFPFPESWEKAEASESELDTFNAWKREMRQWYTDKIRWASVTGEARRLLSSLDVYANRPVWFPVHMDTRGRWYYRGLVNPQGTQLAKALIHFHEKKHLGKQGVYWLKVHIANSFGYDSVHFDLRVKWVDEHWGHIKNALEDPINHPDVWGDESPLVMFSAAYELNQAYLSGDPETYETGIPVAMDATCSGIQHFSALLLDEVGGRHVNLLPNYKEAKEDVYKAAGEAALSLLKTQQAAGHSGLEFVTVQGIGRDLAKQPVMTKVYGVRLMTVIQHVSDWFAGEFNVKLPVGVPTAVAKALLDGLAVVLPSVDSGMHFLQEVARQTSSDHLTWTLPTGMRVYHVYRKFNEVRVMVKSAGLTRLRIRDTGEGVNRRGSVDAISPNFIHSLDAAHITMVGNAAYQSGIHMVGVHDSMGTHPSDVHHLLYLIKDCFVKLYSNDLLKRFKEETETVVPLPPKGKLDLTKVHDSSYFFC